MLNKIRNNKYYILGGLLVLVAAFYSGRQSAPAKVEYRTQIVTKEVVKKDVKTVVKTVKKPDGTVERTRTTEDKSTSNTDTKTSTEQIIASKKLDWRVSGLVGLKDGQQIYGASVERRILGNIHVGIFALPGHMLGASVGMSF
jgi:hypothetical protein